MRKIEGLTLDVMSPSGIRLGSWGRFRRRKTKVPNRSYPGVNDEQDGADIITRRHLPLGFGSFANGQPHS